MAQCHSVYIPDCTTCLLTGCAAADAPGEATLAGVGNHDTAAVAAAWGAPVSDEPVIVSLAFIITCAAHEPGCNSW